MTIRDLVESTENEKMEDSIGTFKICNDLN